MRVIVRNTDSTTFNHEVGSATIANVHGEPVLRLEHPDGATCFPIRNIYSYFIEGTAK